MTTQILAEASALSALDARIRVTAFSIDATNAEVESLALPVPSAPIEDGADMLGGQS